MTKSAFESTAVRVVARCRPLLPSEASHATSRVHVDAEGGKITVAERRLDVARCFSFDRVFPQETQQHDILEDVSPLVGHVLDGFCATIFAYGQTGSGKTHTVEGYEYFRNSKGALKINQDTDPRKHGIIPRLIQLIFDSTREKKHADANAGFRLKCSYYQIYNERVTDLLNPSSALATNTGLKVRWRRDDSFSVENLYICECDSPDKMRRVFLSGAKAKEMDSHLMNQQSSRSHSIFTIHVERSDSEFPEKCVQSQLIVVDLAGSERLTLLEANPSSKLTKESIDINASLFALGKVITTLSQRSKQNNKSNDVSNQAHVPYRDSKLTMLLKHALGGNSLTTMLACISPSDNHVEETLSTLSFASIARSIKNIPYVTQDPMARMVNNLKTELGTVKEELLYYQNLVGSKLLEEGHTLPGRLGGEDGSPSKNVDERVNELSDKLLQACESLQKLMTINRQLREAFDSVKEQNANLERREMELNAENIALRERLEMLESVVLKDDFVSSSRSTPLLVEPFSKDSGALQSSSLGSFMNDSNRPKSCHAPTRPQSNHCPPLPRAHTSAITGQRTTEMSVDESSESVSGNQQNLRPMTEPVVSAASANPAPQGRAVEQSTRREHSLSQKGERFMKGIEEYARCYYHPSSTMNYAQYYGKARRLVNVNHGVVSTSDDINKTLRQIPRSIASTVPASVKATPQFGMLHFGGKPEDVGDLEERRRQREQKRLALIAQQDALRGDVVRAFNGISERKEILRLGRGPPGAGVEVAAEITERQMPTPPSAAISSADSMSRLRTYLEQEIGMRLDC